MPSGPITGSARRPAWPRRSGSSCRRSGGSAQLLIDQEFLADRSAAERYGTSSEYASSLLLLAAPAGKPEGEPPGRPDRGTPPAGTIGVPSALFQRMMMLLHCPYPVESRTPRVWSWTSRLAVIVASIAAACLVIRWPQASLALPAPPAAASSRPPFRVAHFVAKPLPDHARSQRSLVYVLPVALPPRFDLDVDVRSADADLSQVRIAGQPLGLPGGTTATGRPDPDSPVAIGADDATGWHHVHIHRDHHHRLSVMVDGRTIPGPSHTDAATDWLTIEPSSRAPAEFRDLVVTW